MVPLKYHHNLCCTMVMFTNETTLAEYMPDGLGSASERRFQGLVACWTTTTGTDLTEFHGDLMRSNNQMKIQYQDINEYLI